MSSRRRVYGGQIQKLGSCYELEAGYSRQGNEFRGNHDFQTVGAFFQARGRIGAQGYLPQPVFNRRGFTGFNHFTSGVEEQVSDRSDIIHRIRFTEGIEVDIEGRLVTNGHSSVTVNLDVGQSRRGEVSET